MDAGTERRACPVCAATATGAVFVDERLDPGRIDSFTYSSRKTPEFMSLRMVRCADCGGVYAPQPPSSNFLSRAYREAGFASSQEAKEAARAYWRALASRLVNASGGAIEAGAGTGAFLPYLKGAGFDPVVGVEPSWAAIEAADAEARALLKESEFDPADFAAGSFSFFCCFQTLEHVLSPKALMDGAFEVLAPDGLVAVVTHDHSAWLNRLLGRRSPIVDVEHLQLFSPGSLRVLLGRCGFVDVTVEPLRNAYHLRYWLKLFPVPVAVKKVLLRLMEALGLASLVVGGRVGNILATGRKPAVPREGVPPPEQPAAKRNVSVFDRDAGDSEGYVYARNEDAARRLSNARTTKGISDAANFVGKRVLDLGCGDGTFTVELAEMGAARILGIDPAARAIQRAKERSRLPNTDFQVGDIYKAEQIDSKFDVVVLRGVLHHLPDPARAIEIAVRIAGEVVVVEPNGANPALKVIERISRYHREHEEQSFLPSTLDGWFSRTGAVVVHREFINLVPLFCPDWLARLLKVFEPVVERIPLLRVIACGQYVLRAIRR